MIISNMRFDSFEWDNNPLNISISYSRRMTYQNFYRGCYVCEAGSDLKVIKGKGEFAGKGCIKQYETLCRLFEKGRKGLLTLPFAQPFFAYFAEFAVEGDVTPDLIKYTFEFIEAESSEGKDKAAVHIVAEGETLFDIGYVYGVSVEKLVELNPFVKRPDELTVGEEVRLC